MQSLFTPYFPIFLTKLVIVHLLFLLFRGQEVLAIITLYIYIKPDRKDESVESNETLHCVDPARVLLDFYTHTHLLLSQNNGVGLKVKIQC